MDRLTVSELRAHPDKDAAFEEMARRLDSKEETEQRARYESLKQERFWLRTEFRTCAAQHRANLIVTH